MAEIPAHHTTEKNSPDIQKALDALIAHDTLDRYARRLNGTTVLGTRAVTMAGLPATALGLLSQSVGAGIQTLVISGPTTVLGGTVVAAGAYTLHRLGENSRAEAAEAAEQTIRDALEEPVDIVGHKGRGRKFSVRWFGADEQYGGSEAAGVLQRFGKVIEFAEAHKAHDIVVAARLLAPLKDAHDFETTTTTTFFKETKGVAIADKKADAELARLSPSQARELYEKLKKEGAVTRTDALAQLLQSAYPDHPFCKSYNSWQALGKPAHMRPQVAEIVRTSLERHFNSNTLPEAVKVGYQRIRTDSTATVSPSGIQYVTHTRQSSSSNESAAQFSKSSWEQIIGGEKQPFINTLLEQKDTATPAPHERWKSELGLYLLLQDDDTSAVEGLTHQAPSSKALESQTFYSRIKNERPRTHPWWPGVSRRGKVNPEEQTVEYGRYKKVAIKKVAAAALALSIGGGIGYAWGQAWGMGSIAETQRCYFLKSPTGKDGKKYQVPPEERDFCQSLTLKAFKVLDAAADAVYDANNETENYLITKAYELGVINPQNAPEFLENVSEEWKNKKYADLSERFNLYGGTKSMVGDVAFDEKNPAVWSLKPINGARTQGYWHNHVQSHIVLQPNYLGMDQKNHSLPPYSDVTFSFEHAAPLRSLIAPMGTKLSTEEKERVELIREMDVPSVPADLSRPLINVNGRQLTNSGDLVDVGTDYDNAVRMESFALPVLHGADVVGMQATYKSMSTDAVIKNARPRVYQKSDGTFHIMTSDTPDEAYIDLNYWIDPQADTDLPLRAQNPMTAQQRGEMPQPLTSVVSTKGAAKVLEGLGLTEQTNASQIASTVKENYDYSFTPIADNNPPRNKKSSVGNEHSTPTGEVLVNGAAALTKMDGVNCNVAAAIEVVGSRGLDDNGYINAATGFSNNGDNVLSKAESHQYTVNNDGEIIDGTPSGGTPPPAPDAYEDSPQPEPEFIEEAAKITSIATVLGSISWAAYRGGPPMWRRHQRRRQEKAVEWIAAQEDDVLLHSIGILKHLIYTRPDTKLDENHLPISRTRTTQEQLHALPALSRDEVAQLLTERDTNLSKETKEQLFALMEKVKIAR